MDIWEIGDYGIVGDWFASASRSLLDGGHIPPDLTGMSVLDVACGSGTVAIEAARRGADVHGVDSSATMLELARHRAAQSGMEISWELRSFEDLSGLTASTIVTSSFGVMFASDPSAVANQLDGAATPDGVVAITAWHPDGAFGSAPPALVELIGPRPIDVTEWSDPERVESFFAGTGRSVTHHRRGTLYIGFPSVADAATLMQRHAGPWIALFEQLRSIDAVEQGERALLEHLESHSDSTNDGIAVRAEYTVTQLTR